MLLVILCVVIGVPVVLGTLDAAKASSAVRRTSTVRCWRIRDLRESSYGRIVGAALAHGPAQLSPLTGRPCVYWRVKVSEQVGSSLGGPTWNPIIEETYERPFVLSDGTARALIDPAGVQISLGTSSIREAVRFDDRQRAVLERHGIRPGDGVWPRTLRFEETVIAVGEDLAVIGAGSSEPMSGADTGTYRELPERWIRISKAAFAGMRIHTWAEVLAGQVPEMGPPPRRGVS